ncbi:MAG: alpha/beta hydrolase-fold protein [Leptospiraceae bacterium]|nr:alpha/beta hydrolase-fold protein [Leptospiraceae bacterium]
MFYGVKTISNCLKVLSKTVALCFIALLFSSSAIYSFEPEIRKSESGFDYALILPVQFDSNKKYLLGVCLHGLGGTAVSMAKEFSYYTRYMNMILVCPEGNIPDPTKNSKKWGYELSEEYINSFLKFIKTKFKTYDDVVLFGFSQGGNQGLYSILKSPNLFSYFVGISGGYTKIENVDQINSIRTKILLSSGDTGRDEEYVLRMQDRAFLKLKKKADVTRKVLKGGEHKIGHAYAYLALRWYAMASGKFTEKFWLFKGNYIRNFERGEREFIKSNYEKSIKYYRLSLSKNPLFPVSAMRYSQSQLMSGNLSKFEKSFFSALVLYTNFPYYDFSPMKETFSYYRKLLASDEALQSYTVQYLNSRLKETEGILSNEINFELYDLLFYLYEKLNSPKEAKFCKDKAKSYQEKL